MEGDEIPEIAERGGSSIRSRERWLEDLSNSELQPHVSSERSEKGSKYSWYTYVGLSVLCLFMEVWLEAKAVRAQSRLC